MVCQELPRFEYDPNHGKFRSWLFTLAYRKSIDCVRRNSRDRAEPLSELVKAGQEPCSGADGPEAQLQHRWNQEVVQQAMAELRKEVFPNSYEVFVKLSHECCSVHEVARQFNQTPGNIRVIHHRVKQKFKRILEWYLGPDPDLG